MEVTSTDNGVSLEAAQKLAGLGEEPAPVPEKKPEPKPKRKRGRPPKNKPAEQKPTPEQQAQAQAQAQAKQRAEDESEIAALIMGLVGPLNPDRTGKLKEFHYSDQELSVICTLSAKVWLKYMPTGPSKYAEETALAVVLIGSTGPKLAQYRNRRIQEGNPLTWPKTAWRKVSRLFKRKRKAQDEPNQ